MLKGQLHTSDLRNFLNYSNTEQTITFYVIQWEYGIISVHTNEKLCIYLGVNDEKTGKMSSVRGLRV